MMYFRRHCTVAVLALSIGSTSAAGQPATPAVGPTPGEATFAIYVRGTDVGREQVKVTRTASNWIITSTGRSGDLVLSRFELKYSPDWQPTELRIEAVQGARTLTLATSFGVTTAINEITQNGKTTAKTDEISARTVVLPNVSIAAYEALAARLAGLKPGDELPIYVVPQSEVRLTIQGIEEESLQTPDGLVPTRRYEITVHNPTGPLGGTITTDAQSRLARVELPAAGLTAVRSDLAGVAVRSVKARNPTDSDVTIPGNGFTLAGTLTMPPVAGRMKHPAVVLVAGSGAVDRDETVAGIPIFSQLAGALAERGFVVVRYDKRGVGQSGGRTESATLQDYAEDLVSVVKWLERRDDIDGRRIAAVGHSEGGAVTMLAAAREKKIGAVVLVAAPGTTGADLILEQQQHQLGVLKIAPEERQEKEALQRRIQSAVVTGEGWDDLPPELRRQADTPWFRSLLQFDPARAMTRFRQPVLILQGDLDVQVKPHHADKLAELARARKNGGDVELVHLPGTNHLLVPAKTGEVQEYGSLGEASVSPLVASSIADWLNGLD
ncbi:MAG TPA: alpha/beta fold hydrolase [Vicinamibacterales bacterium]|nr:alpha/beta fold hydrolase [Vicinamibacterales bacterium]